MFSVTCGIWVQSLWTYWICMFCNLQVVTKIIKHAREAPSTTAHGLLLGLDLDGVLEVSNSFALPHHAGDDVDKSAKSSGRYAFSWCECRWLKGFEFQHDTRLPCSVRSKRFRRTTASSGSIKLRHSAHFSIRHWWILRPSIRISLDTGVS